MPSTVRLGSRGPDVTAWQTAIGVTADGDFGPDTNAATQAWQASHGLTADGVVGPATWASAGVAAVLHDGLPTPLPGRLLGVDTSVSQGVVDWAALRHEAVSFGIVKATDGLGSVDELWAQNHVGATEAGVLLGAYHVYHPEHDAQAQADAFAAQAFGKIVLSPAIDFELTRGVAADDVLRGALAFVNAVEVVWERRCIVYTGPNFIAELTRGASAAGHDALAELAQRPLWEAHYTTAASPANVPPWTDWSLWQFAGDGGFRMPNGVVVDVNWFQGTLDDLAKLGAG